MNHFKYFLVVNFKYELKVCRNFHDPVIKIIRFSEVLTGNAQFLQSLAEIKDLQSYDFLHKYNKKRSKVRNFHVKTFWIEKCIKNVKDHKNMRPVQLWLLICSKNVFLYSMKNI